MLVVVPVPMIVLAEPDGCSVKDGEDADFVDSENSGNTVVAVLPVTVNRILCY